MKGRGVAEKEKQKYSFQFKYCPTYFSAVFSGDFPCLALTVGVHAGMSQGEPKLSGGGHCCWSIYMLQVQTEADHPIGTLFPSVHMLRRKPHSLSHSDHCNSKRKCAEPSFHSNRAAISQHVLETYVHHGPIPKKFSVFC